VVIRYVENMLRKPLRRISMMVLVLALAAGLVPHGIASLAAGFKPVMASAGNHMPVSGKCADDKQAGMAAGTAAGMAAACAACCSGVIAFSAPVVQSNSIVVDILRPSIDRAATNHTGPPDPHPPKPIGIG
jgi:hypothetical protein